MKIAVLGWGSLVWDPGILRIASDWDTSGPVLPIEFSRISKGNRLTLVIDEANGVAVPTRFAISAFANLDEAIENLRAREGSPNTRPIGFSNLLDGTESQVAVQRHRKACQTIKAWAQEKDLDGVIWTALGPDFKNGRFSVDAAVAHLRALAAADREVALAYIRNAPAEIRTPVRDKVEEEFP